MEQACSCLSIGGQICRKQKGGQISDYFGRGWGDRERERERGRIEFRFLQVPLPLETPHSFRYKGYFIVVVAIVPSYQQPFTKAHIPVTSNSANERFQV